MKAEMAHQSLSPHVQPYCRAVRKELTVNSNILAMLVCKGAWVGGRGTLESLCLVSSELCPTCLFPLLILLQKTVAMSTTVCRVLRPKSLNLTVVLGTLNKTFMKIITRYSLKDNNNNNKKT